MNRATATRARTRASAMRTLVLSASAGIVLCVGGMSTAWAQQSNTPTLDVLRPQVEPWPAPVGHRQPRREDLPPSVRKDEGAITPGQQDFNQSLTICRC